MVPQCRCIHRIEALASCHCPRHGVETTVDTAIRRGKPLKHTHLRRRPFRRAVTASYVRIGSRVFQSDRAPVAECQDAPEPVAPRRDDASTASGKMSSVMRPSTNLPRTLSWSRRTASGRRWLSSPSAVRRSGGRRGETNSTVDVGAGGGLFERPWALGLRTSASTVVRLIWPEVEATP